jgi:hypothetical protein
MKQSVEPKRIATAWLSRLGLRRGAETLARRRIFEAICRDNVWGDPESVSGTGSGRARTALFRDDLVALVRALRIDTLLDAPCGDYNWLGHFDLPIEDYIGVDIVPGLIAANRAKPQAARSRFMVRDIVCDALPRADLILCRDGLVHLSNAEIFATLANFKRSRARWLLTNTFPAHLDNIDIPTGGWRTLNLQAAPFDFPPPACVIDEKCLGWGGVYRDKQLALWDFAVLPI